MKKIKLKELNRREFIKNSSIALAGGGLALFIAPSIVSSAAKYDWTKHEYGYTIEIDRCIGCGMCVKACKAENSVPETCYRTWVERYSYLKNGEVVVDSPKGAVEGFRPRFKEEELNKSFFVPKLCNHCRNPRCVQVCPVGASFVTKEGVVLVDKKHCVGCAYCVQACPYGARYLHPIARVIDKCTWCYHRITKGNLPVCVQVCPGGARKFGDLKDTESQIYNIVNNYQISELKPELKTHPRVYYLGLDKEVR